MLDIHQQLLLIKIKRIATLINEVKAITRNMSISAIDLFHALNRPLEAINVGIFFGGKAFISQRSGLGVDVWAHCMFSLGSSQ